MDLEQPALATPLRFDLRSARVRALLCVLLTRRPRRPDGSEVDPQEAAALLFNRGPESMAMLCATVKDDDLRKSPANRILDVAPSVAGQAKNWILALNPDLRDVVLDSHAIPPESFAQLATGDNDTALRQRFELLSRIEHDFMTRERVRPPTSGNPAPAPLDTDDEVPLSSPGAQMSLL